MPEPPATYARVCAAVILCTISHSSLVVREARRLQLPDRMEGDVLQHLTVPVTACGPHGVVAANDGLFLDPLQGFHPLQAHEDPLQVLHGADMSQESNDVMDSLPSMPQKRGQRCRLLQQSKKSLQSCPPPNS